MAKGYTRTINVKAVQWGGSNLEEIVDFSDGRLVAISLKYINGELVTMCYNGGEVNIGDYIALIGDHIFVKERLDFERTYLEVED